MQDAGPMVLGVFAWITYVCAAFLLYMSVEEK